MKYLGTPDQGQMTSYGGAIYPKSRIGVRSMDTLAEMGGIWRPCTHVYWHVDEMNAFGL